MLWVVGGGVFWSCDWSCDCPQVKGGVDSWAGKDWEDHQTTQQHLPHQDTESGKGEWIMWSPLMSLWIAAAHSSIHIAILYIMYHSYCHCIHVHVYSHVYTRSRRCWQWLKSWGRLSPVSSEPVRERSLQTWGGPWSELTVTLHRLWWWHEYCQRIPSKMWGIAWFECLIFNIPCNCQLIQGKLGIP